MTATVDTEELEAKVKDMYRHVAQQPGDRFHFELGAPVALRAGYDADRLAAVPASAVESFAGVGYFFDLADLQPGESVVDLGSGSGMDAFYAAGLVGETGKVYGIDFTPEQLEKARRLADEAGFAHVEFREGRIEALPLADASVDCVISNGVINLCPDKKAVFTEAARVLRSGAAGDRRHHQRAGARGLHCLQRRPVGLLHRWCSPAGALPPGDRVRRLHHRSAPRERV